MKIKTSELTSAALDWAVAKCRGFDGLDDDLWLMREGIADMPLHAYTPSTDWAQGGPIIEREMLDLRKVYSNGRPSTNPYDCWKAEIVFRDEKLVAGDFFAYGPTPLIAAMRCLIASKLGDEVEVPKELICTS